MPLIISSSHQVIYLAIVETIHSAFEMLIVYEPLVLDFGANYYGMRYH